MTVCKDLTYLCSRFEKPLPPFYHLPERPSSMSVTFGRYELHKKIAQGGMAEVFLATRTGEIGGFKREVAIKRLFPHYVDQEESINMFIDEARIAARLSHPNIVQIYDLGVVDDSFFIAMEYVEGTDLRRLCEQGVDKKNFLSRPLAVHIIAEVAAGLQYAHTRTDDQGRPMNVVHRDVSPQNILISVDGAVKLCDFGIARAESRLTHTQAGEFKGKFAYMSPEQFGRGDLDHRSDIFTLGIVLYEITVATRLFRSRTEYETMRKITEGEVTPPSKIRPDFSPRLEEIILKALATDPEERYQTTAEFHEALEEWLFEGRHRVGARQLASYMEEVHEPPEYEEVLPLAEPKAPKDSTTMEISVSDDAVVEFSAEVELEEEGEGDTTVQDQTFSFDELEGLEELDPDDLEEEETEILHVPEEELSTEAVEIRRITPEEAQRRREGKAAQGVELTEEWEGDTGGDGDGPPDGTTIPRVKEVDPSPSRQITNQWRDRGAGPGPAPGESPVADREAEGSTMDRLLGSLPELKSGGRTLTGLNEVEEEPGDSGTSGKSGDAEEVKIAAGPPSDGAWATAPMEKVAAPLPRRNSLVVLIQGSLPLQIGVVAGVAALVVFFVVLVGTLRSGGEEDGVVDEVMPLAEATEVVGEEEVELSLVTEPADARVIVNGVRLDGKTPLAVPLVKGRSNEVWILRPRYRPVRLFVDGEAGQRRTVEMERAMPTETARVEFRSTPDQATVFLDGEPIGRTPLRLENVPADFESHVQYELEGYRPFVAVVQFRSQGDNRIRGMLAEDRGSRVIGVYEVQPRGSRVFVHGEELSTTPFENEHRDGEWLELKIDGHEREARELRLRLDQIGSFFVGIELPPMRGESGQLSLEVEPNAAIYIDARSYGAGPLTEIELDGGEHTVVLETLEGQRLRVPLTVEGGGHSRYRAVIDGGEVSLEAL